MQNKENALLDLVKESLALRRFTASCRLDMHEPDEQGISAKVSGRTLDNAGVPGEIIVTIKKDDGDFFTINLATLIAIARLGPNYPAKF